MAASKLRARESRPQDSSFSALLAARAPLSGFWKLDPLEAVRLVKRGVPAALLARVSRDMDRPIRYVVRTIGLAQSTASRKLDSNATLNVDESERVLGIAKLIGQAQTIVEESGEPKEFDAGKWVAKWIEAAQPALGGKRPDELMDTADGRRLVSELLARMQSGAYT
jgi:putative toxin-antitoxin system antitoxin component (TIGR02293 family)